MVEGTIAATLEFGRLEFRSWEHDWALGCTNTPTSLAAAQRVLPEKATSAIYDLLRQQEALLLQDTMPFPPFDLRVRSKIRRPLRSYRDANVLILASAATLNTICPRWDKLLDKHGLIDGTQARTKTCKYGTTLRVPTGDRFVRDNYSLEWFPWATDVDIDKMFGEYGPRHKDPSPFDVFDAIHAAKRQAGDAP